MSANDNDNDINITDSIVAVKDNKLSPSAPLESSHGDTLPQYRPSLFMMSLDDKKEKCEAIKACREKHVKSAIICIIIILIIFIIIYMFWIRYNNNSCDNNNNYTYDC